MVGSMAGRDSASAATSWGKGEGGEGQARVISTTGYEYPGIVGDAGEEEGGWDNYDHARLNTTTLWLS